MAKKETAEQKLLKMIETSSDVGGVSSKAGKPSDKKRNIVALFQVINKILIALVVIVVLLIVNELKVGSDLLTRDIGIQDDSAYGRQNQKIDIKNLLLPTQRASYYLASVKQRNVFQPYTGVIADTASTINKNLRISQMMQDFRLVGISWLDTVNTASVMIENKSSQETYFVQKGQKIGDTNIIVKTIYADSAALGYKDEEIIIEYDQTQM